MMMSAETLWLWGKVVALLCTALSVADIYSVWWLKFCNVCHTPKMKFPTCCNLCWLSCFLAPLYGFHRQKEFFFILWLRQGVSMGICSDLFLHSRLKKQDITTVFLLELTYWTEDITWLYVVYLRMFLVRCINGLCFNLAGSLKHTSLLIRTLRILKEKTKNKAKEKYVQFTGTVKYLYC